MANPYFDNVGIRKFDADYSGAKPTIDSVDGVKVGDLALDTSNDALWECRVDTNGISDFEHVRDFLWHNRLGDRCFVFDLNHELSYTSPIFKIRSRNIVTGIMIEKRESSTPTAGTFSIGTLSDTQHFVPSFSIPSGGVGTAVNLIPGPGLVLAEMVDPYDGTDVYWYESGVSGTYWIRLYVFVNSSDIFIGRSSFTTTQTSIGKFFGGNNSNCIIELALTTVSGNAEDKGDMYRYFDAAAACSNSVFIVVTGGHSGTTVSHAVDMVRAVTNAYSYWNKSDLLANRTQHTQVGNGISAFVVGGAASVGGTPVNSITSVRMDLGSADAVDKGDLTVARRSLAGAEADGKAFFGGGETSSGRSNVIDYLSLTGAITNASDKGDLTGEVYYLSAVSGENDLTPGQYLVYFAGGAVAGVPTLDIQYIVANTGAANAVDKGDLTRAKYLMGVASNGSYGFFTGGKISGGTLVNDIDYMQLNVFTGVVASDKGNMNLAISSHCGAG